MTILSRPRSGAPLLTLETSAFTPFFRTWHAFCIVLWSSGCYYFGPLPQVKKNEAPVIIDQNPPSETPLILKDRTVQVFVIARDEDGVTFQWSRSDGTLLGNAQQVNAETSFVEIAPDPDVNLDGQSLRCTIYDGAVPPASVILTWPLEVP